MKTKLFAIVVAVMLLLSPSTLFAQGETETPPADTIPPADVENLKAIAGDKEVTLTWDVATDNVGVTGYKIYYGTNSVREDGGNYEFPALPVEDIVTHTVTSLENGKTYYFAMTAVDATNNESTNYSLEVNATPEEGLKSAALEDDGKPPELKKVEAKAKDEVRVEFSEPVILPIENPEKAFTITKGAETLDLKEAELDSEDPRGATVLLLTTDHEAGEEYELTVDITVEDHFGNAVVKDKNDKMIFRGFGTQQVAEAGQPDTETEPVAKPEPEQPLPAPPQPELPTLQEVKSADRNQIHVIFSMPVKLSQNPKSHFSIMKKPPQETQGTKSAAPETFLKVNNVSLSKDGKTVYLNTDPQEVTIYEARISGLIDPNGNALESQTVEFQGSAASLFDLIPPEDVTELIAKLTKGKRDVVELMWKKSKNTAGDLSDHLFYQSEDQGTTFNAANPLGKDTEKTQAKGLTPGKEYTFKITAKDFSGNESKGTIVSIRLPEVGPGLPIIVVFSLLAGYLRKRRKK